MKKLRPCDCKDMEKAKDQKCIKCNKQAVAFFPAFDPDIKSFPYCRKCLDEVKLFLIIKLNDLFDDK